MKLTYFSFAKEPWRTIRTTTILEWAFREVRISTESPPVFAFPLLTTCLIRSAIAWVV